MPGSWDRALQWESRSSTNVPEDVQYGEVWADGSKGNCGLEHIAKMAFWLGTCAHKNTLPTWMGHLSALKECDWSLIRSSLKFSHTKTKEQLISGGTLSLLLREAPPLAAQEAIHPAVHLAIGSRSGVWHTGRSHFQRVTEVWVWPHAVVRFLEKEAQGMPSSHEVPTRSLGKQKGRSRSVDFIRMERGHPEHGKAEKGCRFPDRLRRRHCHLCHNPPIAG